MNKHATLGVTVALLVAASTSPAWADRRTDERLDALEARVERVDRLMENNALLDLVTRMDAMQQELRELRGRNEELAHQVETLKSRQRELYLDLDRRIQEVEMVAPAANAATGGAASTVTGEAVSVTADPGASPATAGASAPAEGGGAAVAPAGEREAYKQAFDLLRNGQYEQAIGAFQSFLQKHPKSGYAGNAQYWLGEANYVSKQYDTAVTEFRKVIENHPDSNKVADARLKLGFTYYELGQWARARETLTEVQTQYPGSTVARLADQRLARMTREGH